MTPFVSLLSPSRFLSMGTVSKMISILHSILPLIPQKKKKKQKGKKKQSLKPILKPIDRGRMIQMLLSSSCIAPSPIQTIFLIAQWSISTASLRATAWTKSEPTVSYWGTNASVIGFWRTHVVVHVLVGRVCLWSVVEYMSNVIIVYGLLRILRVIRSWEAWRRCV